MTNQSSFLRIGLSCLMKIMNYSLTVLINYTFLRNAFCTALLNELESRLGKSFKPVKADIYKNHIEGFYVHAKPNMCEPKQIAKYIGRYLGRPVIATKRIDKYDGENVTFHYNRHEDEKLIVETIPALEFMERLVQHIPEKNFKMILAENTKDSADNIIFENITEKDIAITRDILLAERLVQKNIKTINDRGTYFSKENIKKKVEERNYDFNLAQLGFSGSKEKNYGMKELKKFRECFEKTLKKIYQEN